VVLVTEIDGQSTENEGNFPLAALLVLGATDGSPVTLHILSILKIWREYYNITSEHESQKKNHVNIIIISCRVWKYESSMSILILKHGFIKKVYFN
jgi:hypothetical protein